MWEEILAVIVRDPIGTFLIVVGFAAYIGMFVTFMGIISAVGEVLQESDQAIEESRKVRDEIENNFR